MLFSRVIFPTSFAAIVVAQSTTHVSKTLCGGKNYTYDSLAGFGLVPSNSRDKFGDTLGGFGSAIAFDRAQWKKLSNGTYTGTMYALPDRGWNTQGTVNFQARVHKFGIVFTPSPSATSNNPSGNNLFITYQDSTLLFAPDGITPTTGLDADVSGHITYPGFPDLPAATFKGDGWGGSGPGGKAISIDAEGLVLAPGGGFYVSDEYGPYVYRFDATGKMLNAIRPNDAIIPMRDDEESFSASADDNPTGRNNNKGFEGMGISEDGRSLYVLLQSAANQEGGLKKSNRRYPRLVKYDITDQSNPIYANEFVVPLPFTTDEESEVAGQSEIFNIQGGDFFILSRDSGAGHGQDDSTSVYRHIDIFNVELATDIKGKTYDCTTCNIASSKGKLEKKITPAEYCPFIDFNLNSELNRFGVHNGGNQDSRLLNEKWESIAMVPVDGAAGEDNEWFIFSVSDNDFITQSGFMHGGLQPYSDPYGFNLDSQALVFKVTLPGL
ncbi:hypothetical protein HYALB_00011990 [Hymenoscyphus albidus]|uniref:Phytase-like domain-containing protein n=1 Tax=Hymenoscyphus albidus TaxID=595503 RepID=A0A9N9LW68_9HELO|nr:hypothetical protein HYALB_00011990 [Hymenoscyphus albidus]